MATTPNRRRVFIGTAIGAFLALSVAAIAAFIIVATINGSITTGQFAIFGTSGGTVTDGNETAGTCTVAMTNAGTGQNPTYSVTWTGGPIAGDSCTATLGVEAEPSNTVAGIVQLASVGPNITGGEVVATLGAACGKSIAPAAATTIPVTFTITNQASPGEVLDLTGSTIEIVPAGTEDLGPCT